MVKLRGPGASANISFRVLSSGVLPAIETWITRKYAFCIYLELPPTVTNFSYLNVWFNNKFMRLFDLNSDLIKIWQIDDDGDARYPF